MTQRETVNSSIIQDTSGKYRWVYELPMLKSFFLLLEVWKVLGISAMAVYMLMFIINLIEGYDSETLRASVKVMLLVLAILIIISIPAYWIVTKANNGKYTVLFEMDDSGIDHIQIKSEKAKALEILTTFVGLKTKNRTTTAAGLLSATGGSLYSHFENIKTIKPKLNDHLIILKGNFFSNHVYVSDEDFDFVYQYIVEHCPYAKKG